jgi:hypothetical protein
LGSPGAGATDDRAPAPELSATVTAILRAHLGASVTHHDVTLVKDWERNVVVR